MKKITPIKWRKQDQIKISTYIRKFNAAITRFEKQHPEYIGTTIIPERIDASELKSGIKTRVDYNRFIASVDRFFKPGAREVTEISGIKITKWQKKELQYQQHRINQENKRRIKEMRYTKTEQRHENIYDIDIKKKASKLMENFKKTMDTETLTQDFFNLVYRVERESRYGKQIEDSIRYYMQLQNAYKAQLEPEDAKRVLAKIEELDLKGYDLYYAGSVNDVILVDFIYGPEDSKRKADLIIETLEEIFVIDESEQLKAELERQKILEYYNNLGKG